MKTKNLISLAVFAVLVTSCDRPVYRYYELTKVDKQMIPYELGQIVSFIDSEGLPFILTVTQDTTYYLIDRQMDNLYYAISERVIRLQSERLGITLAVLSNFSNNEYNTIRVSISIGIESVTSHRYDINYDKNGYFLGSIHNSIDINGKVYYDVVECNTATSINGQPSIPTQLFYNKTYGILQINRDGENFLTINQ